MKKKNKIEEIDRIIKVEIIVFKIYKNLLELELKGKKQSKEYLKYLEYLSTATEVEDKFINESKVLNKNITPSIIDTFLKRSEKYTEQINFYDDVKENTPDNNLIVARIISKAINNTFSADLNKVDIIDADIENGVYNLVLPLNYIESINYVITKESEYHRLNNIYELLKKETDKNIINNLIIHKYILMYISEYEKIDYLKNDNNIKHLEELGYFIPLCEVLYNKSISKLMNESISDIINIKDTDNKDDFYKSAIEIACNDCLTAFSLCSDIEEQTNFMSAVESIINTIIRMHPEEIENSKVSVNRLINVLNEAYQKEIEKENKKIIRISDKTKVKIK